jgi:spore germination protein YaaH
MEGKSMRKRLSAVIMTVIALVVSLLPAVAMPSALTSQVAAETKPPRKIVSGWMPYWSTKASLSTITAEKDLYGEVNVFWFSLKSATQIADQYDPSNSAAMSTTMASLKAQGVKVFATFTDGTGRLVLQGILKDPTQRARLVSTLTNFAVRNGFDGIDLDFEGFAFSDGTSSWATTQPLWTTFITELSAAMKAQRLLLSVTTPEVRDPASGKRGYWVYDWPGIAPHIDRLRIMTYDYSVARSGPIGPISWAEQTTKYAATLMAPSKIYVGVATYGRDWVVGLTGTCPVGVNLVAQTATVNGTRATVLSNSAVALAKAYGATPTWNAQYAESTFTYRKTYAGKTSSGADTSCTATRTVWYQDARAALERAKLVGKYRLGGIALWYIGQEETGTWGAIREYARTIAPDKVALGVTAPANLTRYGSALTISGKFTISDGRPVDAGDVVLQSQLVGESAWTDLASTPSNPDGTVSFKVVAGKPRNFRLFAPATWDRFQGVSGSIAPALRRMVVRDAPLTARRKLAFAVTGQITPAAVDVPLSLQVFRNGVWRTVRTGVSDAEGRFSLSSTPTVFGPTLYRVVVQPSGGYGRTNSAAITVMVR